MLRKQRICRLQGNTHSYFIFDNPKYRLAKQIYYSMEEYELTLREQRENDNALEEDLKAYRPVEGETDEEDHNHDVRGHVDNWKKRSQEGRQTT